LDRFNALKKNGKSGLALSTTSAFSSMIAGAYSGFAADAGELFMHVRHRLVRESASGIERTCDGHMVR
jgi:hypothetical protein